MRYTRIFLQPIIFLPVIKITSFIFVMLAIIFYSQNPRIAIGVIVLATGTYGLAGYLLDYYRKKMVVVREK